MSVICLLTSGQPSTNPRLVKEADALAEAGHTVHVICGYWARWADETDKEIIASRRFNCMYVGGHPATSSSRYAWTRLRHRLSREIVRLRITSLTPMAALARVSPDLQAAAIRTDADMYIAHHIGALPAACEAARRRDAKIGFDAEDLHSGMSAQSDDPSIDTELAERFERRLLPQCDYMTAAAPLIADRYAAKYHIRTPSTILNVFPLADRPTSFRESESGSRLTLYWFSQTIGAGRGLEDVVGAMGLLRAYDIALTVQGEWQPGYEETLRRFGAEKQLRPEQIRSVPPSRPDALVRCASRFDVGLALEPGRDENNNITLSNKLFTYFLAGNAIMATATDGQSRLIGQTEGAGFCYAPGDANALADQVRAWYVDRAALNAARHRAWNYGTQKFNWDLEKSKFLGVVEGVLNPSAARIA
jgi:glycosyltransferase involved in cell wall biosynthesis